MLVVGAFLTLISLVRGKKLYAAIINGTMSEPNFGRLSVAPPAMRC